MSIKPAHILGLNSRYQYTKLNSREAKKYGFSKLRTKELLTEHGIPTPQVYHIFENLDDLENIIWENIPIPFVIKPASGSAGKGIWIITKKMTKKPIWKNFDGEQLTAEDMNLHVGNILDGEFSTWGTHHRAIIEEMIPPHPRLARYAYKGTPDIRVVVFNSVPVMAMMRVPTKESQGRANLDKGALGLGVDMATGITTHGIKGKGEKITHFPNTKRKINGIKIPQWRKTLEVAVLTSNAAGYQFMGADIFIHPEKGPMVVEVNGFPGLSIQLANRAGLKRRIERVEGLEVRDAKHGVKISQALFAERFADQITSEEGLAIISTDPIVYVYDDERNQHTVNARVNTGRTRSAISRSFAEKLGLVDVDDLLWQQQEAIEGKVPVVEVKFKIKDKKITTAMVVTKRLDKKKYKVEIGKRDLEGFLVGKVQ